MGLSEVKRGKSEIKKEDHKENNHDRSEYRILIEQALPKVKTVTHGIEPPQVDQEIHGDQAEEKNQQYPAQDCSRYNRPSGFPRTLLC